jgi:hypothetical protein
VAADTRLPTLPIQQFAHRRFRGRQVVFRGSQKG